MILYPRNTDIEGQYTYISIDGRIITNTKYIKLLGIHVDCSMNFSGHISELCKKVSKKIGILMRLCNLIPRSAKLTIYKSSIPPYLTYCHLVWHFCKVSDSRKIERLQERALRAVYKSASQQTLLKISGLPTLQNRRLQDIAILMYKVKNNLAPTNVAELFNLNNSRNSLRNKDFHLPRFNTITYGKHSFRYFGLLLWKRLNNKVKQSPSLQSFKTAIRNLDISGILENN